MADQRALPDRSTLIDVDDAVEKRPEEHIGEQAAAQTAGEHLGFAVKVLVEVFAGFQ